jgi:arrestin-1
MRTFLSSLNIFSNCFVKNIPKFLNFNFCPKNRLASPDQRDAFGIIVSYAVKVKLFLGALGGEVTAELPFVLMFPKPTMKGKLVQQDSQADVALFRSDTIMDPEAE